MTTERQTQLQNAAKHLSKRDPSLAPLIARFGPCTIEPHNDYYRELVGSIISQQLSVKAAATILKRFMALFGDTFPTPQQILRHTIDELRAVGMSRAKASYVLDLATHILENKLQPQKLHDLSNDEVIRELVAVKGISGWPATMIMIYSLGRL